MPVQDHFSQHAATYQRFRPAYPPALAGHLAAIAPARTLAMDLATGSGQAALELAKYFELVLASDASAAQLAHAAPHPRIRYLRHAAECLPIAAGVADLLVVAQAAHWFELGAFYAEARRVLKPRGIVALISYELPRVDATIDAAIERFYREVVGRYWPVQRRYVEAGYRTLPFPLDELSAPALEVVTEWPLEHLLGYLGTWSAVGRYRSAEGRDPVALARTALAPLWPAGGLRRMVWPLHLRLGRGKPI